MKMTVALAEKDAPMRRSWQTLEELMVDYVLLLSAPTPPFSSSFFFIFFNLMQGLTHVPKWERALTLMGPVGPAALKGGASSMYFATESRKRSRATRLRGRTLSSGLHGQNKYLIKGGLKTLV
jgi:hypothetical protein